MLDLNKIKKLLSPNCTIGRGQYKPEAIVIHITEGSFKSALDWTRNVKSSASYHYLIAENGEIIETVNPENTAWHAGLEVKSVWTKLKRGINPNLYTIGIAFAGTTEVGPTRLQIFSMSELCVALCDKYVIHIDNFNIIGHNEIRTDKLCPSKKMDLTVLRYLALLKS